ncbi:MULTISPECIES: acyl-CoA thioesterase [Salipiger]|uniref:Putative thioesterase n=1 Tax=Salipiger bermudensis (strain DSM 26914 / JCM 13377 / KCTC 12554 / HTCC2601) TaxID=314265 RepID=Q0FLV5_SALBH|nr:thioesterase family protein [Salipiger bermudensis]MAE88753.1 acyl-CoA thioesterase [Pelagibaca sp.]MBR9892315.1 acyl-CoA thioesterase [bacterium]EAU45129.1 Putative thioesterase [Salipiger bermudensis HTCC2601]MBN9677901.1 acyl-CoA thioesterase [Salipiger bermudensis]MCA1285471.1 acyl-CoA thioesterase [Salipiger bermudensis]
MTRKAPSPRSAYRAFFSVQTRWDDNDLYGHINNVTYLKYIDTVVALWQTGQGVDLGADADLRYLVVESGATYHSEARFPEQLHAGLRVGRLGNSSVRYEVGIFREDDEIACVEGFFIQVAVDRDTRPAPVPAGLRAALETILA